jgi:ABC-2 type transport system permease protein
MKQLGGRWRVALTVFLAILPIALAIVVVLAQSDEESFDTDFINILLDGLLVGGILPIVTMAMATAAFGNELEDKTLSYIVLKPIPRWQIAVPKLLASILLAGPLIIASGAIAAWIGMDSDPRISLAVGLALFAGVTTYASIFTWAGLMTTRALAFAIVYVFLWEGLISSFINGVDYLSVRGYTLAIMHGLDTDSMGVLSERVIEFPAAIVGALTVSVVFFFLTVRRLQNMDVP